MARTGTDKNKDLSSYLWTFIRIDPEYRNLYDSIRSILEKRPMDLTESDHDKYDDAKEILRSKWKMQHFIDYKNRHGKKIKFIPQLSPVFWSLLGSQIEFNRIQIWVDTRFSKNILLEEFEKVLDRVYAIQENAKTDSKIIKKRPEHIQWCKIYEEMIYVHPDKSYPEILASFDKRSDLGFKSEKLSKAKLSKIKSDMNDLILGQKYMPSIPSLNKLNKEKRKITSPTK
jgi:hypothetical protein